MAASSGAESNDDTSSEAHSVEGEMALLSSARHTRSRAHADQQHSKLPNNTDRLPWTVEQGAEKTCLIVVQQPEAEFYKDQGGKGSHLTVTVRLAPEAVAKRWAAPIAGKSAGVAHNVPLPDPAIFLPLEATLLYESGKKVDDTNILRLMHKKTEVPALELRLHNEQWWYEGEVHFRLEKVSLRNDGQRFKLQVRMANTSEKVEDIHQTVLRHGLCASHEHHAWLSRWMDDVKSCCTVPITVLSKRKTPANSASCDPHRARMGHGAGRGAAQPMKRARGGAAVDAYAAHHYAPQPDVSQVLAKMTEMQASMDMILRLVQTNHERLNRVEHSIHQWTQSLPRLGSLPGLSAPRLASMPSEELADTQITYPWKVKDKATERYPDDGGAMQTEEAQNSSMPLPLVSRAPSWGPIPNHSSGDPTSLSLLDSD